jgi:hypothetical protein
LLARLCGSGFDYVNAPIPLAAACAKKPDGSSAALRRTAFALRRSAAQSRGGRMSIALVCLLLTVFGLLLTAVGAWTAARAVIIAPGQAVNIGISRHAATTFEANLKNPVVQVLLRQSRLAQWGLYMILIGSVLQLTASLLPMIVSH